VGARPGVRALRSQVAGVLVDDDEPAALVGPTLEPPEMAEAEVEGREPLARGTGDGVDVERTRRHD